MSDLKALIIRNEMGLEKSEVDRLLAYSVKSSLPYLSPEREAGPFLLFCCGDDLPTIMAKTNLPRDVLLGTAIHYRWPEKAKVLQRTDAGIVPNELQKDLINTILVATVVAMQRELGEVIAGRKEAKDCDLIPSSMGSLEKLMNMVSALNAPPGAAPAASSGTTVHATNVQIVNQAPGALPPEPAPDRNVKLKALEESAG